MWLGTLRCATHVTSGGRLLELLFWRPPPERRGSYCLKRASLTQGLTSWPSGQIPRAERHGGFLVTASGTSMPDVIRGFFCLVTVILRLRFVDLRLPLVDRLIGLRGHGGLRFVCAFLRGFTDRLCAFLDRLADLGRGAHGNCCRVAVGDGRLIGGRAPHCRGTPTAGVGQHREPDAGAGNIFRSRADPMGQSMTLPQRCHFWPTV